VLQMRWLKKGEGDHVVLGQGIDESLHDSDKDDSRNTAHG
jgi:hypothetical protein